MYRYLGVVGLKDVIHCLAFLFVWIFSRVVRALICLALFISLDVLVDGLDHY
jgi:hypothetical protein